MPRWCGLGAWAAHWWCGAGWQLASQPWLVAIALNQPQRALAKKCYWWPSTICSCSEWKCPWPFGPPATCNLIATGYHVEASRHSGLETPSQAPELPFFSADRVWQVWKHFGVQPAVGRRCPVSCFSGCSSQRPRSSASNGVDSRGRPKGGWQSCCRIWPKRSSIFCWCFRVGHRHHKCWGPAWQLATGWWINYLSTGAGFLPSTVLILRGVSFKETMMDMDKEFQLLIARCLAQRCSRCVSGFTGVSGFCCVGRCHLDVRKQTEGLMLAIIHFFGEEGGIGPFFGF